MAIVYGFVAAIRVLLTWDTLSSGSGISIAISLFAGLVVCVCPVISLPMGLVILILAGKSELGPLWTQSTDVTFLVLLGFVVLAGIHLIAANSKSKTILVNIHSIVAFAMMFAILYAIQFSFSDPTSYAIDKVIRNSTFSFLMVVIAAHLLRTYSTQIRFLQFYILVVGAMSGLALGIAIAKNGILGIQRITPVGGGPITMARFTGFAALVCLAIYFEGGKKRFLVVFGYFMAFTLLSGSRGPLFAVLGTILVMFFSLWFLRALRARAKLFVGFISVSVTALVAIFVIAVLRGAPFAQRYVLLVTEEGGGNSAALRSTWISQAGGFIQSSPFWGHGVASWPKLINSSAPVAYPHNIFAELFVENGLLGATTFSFVLVLALSQALILLLRAEDSVSFSAAYASLSLLLLSLFNAQLSGDLFDNRYIWFAFGWIAALSSQAVLGRKDSAGLYPQVEVMPRDSAQVGYKVPAPRRISH